MRKLASLATVLLSAVLSIATIGGCGSPSEPTATPVARTQQVKLTNPQVPPEDVLEQVSFVPIFVPAGPTPGATQEGGAKPTVEDISNRLEVDGGGLMLSGFEPYRPLRILVYQEDTSRSALFVTEWFSTVDKTGQKELQVSEGDPREYMFVVLDANSGEILCGRGPLSSPLK